MASTAKRVIEYLQTLDEDQMVIWQVYTQDDFEIGDNFYASKETWNEFAEANSNNLPDWSMPYDEIEDDLRSFVEAKQDACEHAEVDHVGSSAHLAFCKECQLEFDCECKDWEG
jgi:hypothetical protein